MASADSTPLQAAPRNRRRWLRFSLRTLLIVITVFGVWLGIKVDQARRQKRAVDTLRGLGAEITYEHQRVKNGFDTKIDLNVPVWARELCGDDFFQTVTGVYYWRRVSEDRKTLPQIVTDKDLTCLADLPHLEVLRINGAPITDAGLAHLPHPERLTSVTLNDTNNGDDFLRRLKRANRLETLWLQNTKVTDAGLTELSGITTLRSLSLLGTQTGDQGLAAFSACRQLEVLKPGREVTNEGFQQFETLENVEFLIADCPITGAALRGFRLPKVDEVYLSNTAVSDDDLPPLVQALRDVRVLRLDECHITDRGLRHLKTLRKTELLVLSNTEIRGRALHHLASLSGIQALALSGCPLDDPDLKSLEPLYTGAAPGGNLTLDNTPVTDDDLEKLSGFGNLMYLGVSHTSVTDDGLLHLHPLKKLLRIDLRGTRVTAAGVEPLKQAIRGLKVAWDEDPQPAGWRPQR